MGTWRASALSRRWHTAATLGYSLVPQQAHGGKASASPRSSPRRWHTAATLGSSVLPQHAHAGKLVHIIATWMRWCVSTLITQALAHWCHPGLFMCAPARLRGFKLVHLVVTWMR